MKYIFLLSGEHKDLAVAEVKETIKGVYKETEKFVIVESSDKPCFSLAFTKKIFLVVEDFEKYKGSIRVDKIGIPSQEAQKLVFEKLKNPVNLENPDHRFTVIKDKKLFICEEIWENTEKFSERANQKRPAPHPTSLPPKLARAMVNLSGAKKEILDPFCGSGGILLEGGLMGLQIKGVDIDPLMIKRAKINLDYFSVKGDLLVGDAMRIKDKIEAIVTDMPYGRNSKAENLEELYVKFLNRAHKMTNSLVIGFPSLDVEPVKKWKYRFEWKLHKSLKKIIYVLK